MQPKRRVLFGVLLVLLWKTKGKKKETVRPQKIQINISARKPTASPRLPSQTNMTTPPFPTKMNKQHLLKQ